MAYDVIAVLVSPDMSHPHLVTVAPLA